MEEMSIKRAARPARSSELFAKTRTTLLRRVNAGDREAFEEFYNLYAPAMWWGMVPILWGQSEFCASGGFPQ